MKACPVARLPNQDADNKTRDRFRKDDAISKRYSEGHSGTVWRRLSKTMRSLNPICQRIVRDPLTGKMEQCHNPSFICHHRVSPRVNPNLFFVASNLACYCLHCHPDTEGDPLNWKEGVDFVPTVLPKRIITM
jgi:hypothetical protein